MVFLVQWQRCDVRRDLRTKGPDRFLLYLTNISCQPARHNVPLPLLVLGTHTTESNPHYRLSLRRQLSYQREESTPKSITARESNWKRTYNSRSAERFVGIGRIASVFLAQLFIFVVSVC